MQETKFYDDYSGQEIQGMMIRPALQFAREGLAPNQAEQELMRALSPLAFSSLENMLLYFGERFALEGEK